MNGLRDGHKIEREEVMIKRYLLMLGIFLVVDSVWLGVIAPKFYKSQIGHLMSEKVNWMAALIFYLIYIITLLIFVVNPSVDKNSILQAAMLGALLGLAMYATYDLTNHATLKLWPTLVTVVDIVWGTAITTVTSVLSTWAILHLKW